MFSFISIDQKSWYKIMSCFRSLPYLNAKRYHTSYFLKVRRTIFLSIGPPVPITGFLSCRETRGSTCSSRNCKRDNNETRSQEIRHHYLPVASAPAQHLHSPGAHLHPSPQHLAPDPTGQHLHGLHVQSSAHLAFPGHLSQHLQSSPQVHPVLPGHEAQQRQFGPQEQACLQAEQHLQSAPQVQPFAEQGLSAPSAPPAAPVPQQDDDMTIGREGR